MINKGQIELTARYYGHKAVTSVYRGAMLIWEAINSCFGSGLWRKDMTWRNTDLWTRF